MSVKVAPVCKLHLHSIAADFFLKLASSFTALKFWSHTRTHILWISPSSPSPFLSLSLTASVWRNISQCRTVNLKRSKPLRTFWTNLRGKSTHSADAAAVASDAANVILEQINEVVSTVNFVPILLLEIFLIYAPWFVWENGKTCSVTTLRTL